MCVSEHEGLLLERTEDGFFRRLGVFGILVHAWFEEKEISEVTLI